MTTNLIAVPVEPSGAAVRGGYFVATNPTFGTGIAASTATRTTYNADEVMLLCDFPASAAGAVMVPDFIRLLCTAAGTGYTSLQMALVLAEGVRFSEFGVELTGGKNANLQIASAPAARWFVHGGSLVVSSASSPRQVARFVGKSAALLPNDELLLSFGSHARGAGLFQGLPPVVLRAGTSLALHCWGPGMTAAPSVEVSIGWREQAA